MTIALDLSDELQSRVAAIAARSNLTADQIVADALENGHSLEWQEQLLEKVASGLSDAEQGRFASEAELDNVLRKYRPA
jgi:predicted transcriptional regulator